MTTCIEACDIAISPPRQWEGGEGARECCYSHNYLGHNYLSHNYVGPIVGPCRQPTRSSLHGLPQSSRRTRMQAILRACAPARLHFCFCETFVVWFWVWHYWHPTPIVEFALQFFPQGEPWVCGGMPRVRARRKTASIAGYKRSCTHEHTRHISSRSRPESAGLNCRA